MPTGMTFNSLVTDLQAYAQRGKTISDAVAAAEIPRVINRCEVALARALKIQGTQNTVTSFMDPAANGVYAKPADWLNTISITFGTGSSFTSRTPLLPRSYEYCNMYWPDRTLQDEPEYYADYNLDWWLFVPSPNLLYPYETLYNSTPPLLDLINQTNWLTEHMPDILLNDCVIAFGTFLGWNDGKLAGYRTMRDAAMGAVSTQEIAKIVDRATTRKTA